MANQRDDQASGGSTTCGGCLLRAEPRAALPVALLLAAPAKQLKPRAALPVALLPTRAGEADQTWGVASRFPFANGAGEADKADACSPP